ncbi:MAG TPA: hypothetical protein VKT77_17275 [Chthonomonadaceae bacterium]|nr:hypothetical protein [Chthonomonadaceae bacterium]
MQHDYPGRVGPLLDTLRNRRSRRFGLGMEMPEGPLAYRSSQPPVPLSEEEEALLAFAACGITGYALGDLGYAAGQGGTILARVLGRTVPSGDAIQTVSLVVTNDDATYLLKRPQDFPPDQIRDLARLAEHGEFVELYRRSRMKIKDGRAAPSLEPMVNLNVNRWSLYRPGSSYFLPVNEATFLYINGLLEIFDEASGAMIVDERAGFRPAGIKAFMKSKGGHLDDDPRSEKTVTIQMVESLVTEFVTAEQGMVIQNLALMAEAIGLGGFPHWAAHAYGWFEALGCRMGSMAGSRYLGMSPLLGKLAGLLGRDTRVPYVQGFDGPFENGAGSPQGPPLLAPYCPPYFPSMEAAVRAVVEAKFGVEGTYRGGSRHSAWRRPEAIAQGAPAPSERCIQATIACCDYIYRTYGRFPAYSPPLRTVLGFQANHLDLGFYDQHYRPEAISDSLREHFACWHGKQHS